jgi:hypothetical protein
MGLLETKRQEDPNATVKLSAADVVDHMHAKVPGWRCSSFATPSRSGSSRYTKQRQTDVKALVQSSFWSRDLVVASITQSRRRHDAERKTNFPHPRVIVAFWRSFLVEWCVRMVRDHRKESEIWVESHGEEARRRWPAHRDLSAEVRRTVDGCYLLKMNGKYSVALRLSSKLS